MPGKQILADLEKIVGKGDALTSKISREVYYYDSSPFFYEPEAAVFQKVQKKFHRCCI
mgnify:CR=1 FL=1